MTKFLQISIFFSIILFTISSNAIEQNVLNVDTGKGCYINIDDNATIGDLKNILATVFEIPIENQQIFAAGSEQEDTRIIATIPHYQRSPIMLLKKPSQDNLKEIRAHFNRYLKNGDHEMAYMTALSIIDRPHRYTEAELQEVNSWLGKLPY